MTTPVIRRRLVYVGYPNAGDFDAESAGDCHALLYWLEDNKLRALEPEERAAQLQHSGGDATAERHGRYLALVGCPHAAPAPATPLLTAEQLTWLLDQAVELDHADRRTDVVATAVLQQLRFEQQLAEQPDKRQQLHDGLLHIAEALGFARGNFEHASPVSLLKTLHTIISNYTPPASAAVDDNDDDAHTAASDDDAAASSTEPIKARLQDKGVLSLDDVPLGFRVADAKVEACAKVLRLLYIEDLKELQSEINHLIEALQQLTGRAAAVDSTLGCHGR